MSSPDVRSNPVATAGPGCIGLILAAGFGERLHAGEPKGLVRVRGRTLLGWTLRHLARWPFWTTWVVVVPPGLGRRFRAILPRRDPLAMTVRWTEGGATRSQSTVRGLAMLEHEPDPSLVLVHDAARPLVSPHLLDRIRARLLAGAQAVVPVLPIPDTVKQVRDHTVVGTVNRDQLRISQTPQGFRLGLLRRALLQPAHTSRDWTDDAQAVEASGATVVTVPGDPWNRKITYPEDLRWLHWALRVWPDR